jgi:hypothetical protein
MAPRVLAALALLARLADHGAAAQARIGIEDLRPAVAEPAVAHDQHPLAVGELARHGFHAEGAAAGNQHGRVGVIDLLEHAQDVLHHAHELLGHVVERSIGVDHREFEQAIGIDIGQKSGHGGYLHRKQLGSLSRSGTASGPPGTLATPAAPLLCQAHAHAADCDC